MEVTNICIALIGGMVSGVINTLAGNGSAITLLILTEVLGLSPNLANGSNRLGVLAVSGVGTSVFYRNGKLKLRRSAPYLIFTTTGAIAGILIAIWVSNEQFYSVFRIMMVVMLLVILVKPARWLRETDYDKKPNLWLMIPLCLAIGLYGGFIQMGMGIFFLAAMVLGARYSITDGNAVKLVVVGIYTLIAVIIFQSQGLIHWKYGLLLAAGQGAGAYFAANFASRHPKANLWAYRLLVLIVILAIVKMFNLFSIF